MLINTVRNCRLSIQGYPKGITVGNAGRRLAMEDGRGGDRTGRPIKNEIAAFRSIVGGLPLIRRTLCHQRLLDRLDGAHRAVAPHALAYALIGADVDRVVSCGEFREDFQEDFEVERKRFLVQFAEH